jgi:4-alpha-glucanotransferase
MKQWKEVHRYARKCGVTIFGDLPYYVAYDSSDVWASQRTFRLDRSRDPVDVGGVPPDYFSAGGQLWGNPVYDWPKLKKDEYSWWVQRIRKSFELFDWVRIDHFRAFESFWAVPYGSTDAINGRWVPGPGNHFFQTLRKTIKKLPLIAEDLGMITKEVNDLRTAIGIPGMRVLQFAFDGGVDNPHRPHNIDRDSVIYTGTHDNDTSIGWLATASAGLKDFICRYLGSPGDRIMDHIISTAYMSVADWCILPFQDVLLLDGYHRMNTPGTADNNWRWRFTYPMVNEDRLNTIAYVTDLYGRYTPDGKS